MAELTGRIRLRIWKKKLIVQVEEKGSYTDSLDGYVTSRDYVEFRDATVEDFLIFDIENKEE